jgi:UDP-glucose 4-epimerase
LIEPTYLLAENLMHFIITGGAGFIGSHLIEALIADDHQLTIVDNLSTGKPQNLSNHENLRFVKADILHGLSIYLPEQLSDRYDGLVHLAATPSVEQSWQAPLVAHENNLSTTLAVIQLCHRLNIPRLVFASSAAVYGNPQQSRISETDQTSPISPYGLHKLASEQYIALFSKQFGISSVNLRMFNVFGPRQAPDSPYSGAISIFASAMMAQCPLTLYGDGSQTRDFVYVKDVAIAFKKALTLDFPPSSSLTCNIGTGQAISLLELIGTLKSCLPHWQADLMIKSPRTGDIQHSQADITLATAKLEFTPQWSLEKGLRALIDDLKNPAQN